MNETGVTSHRRGQAVNSNEFPQFGQPPATTPLLILLRLLVWTYNDPNLSLLLFRGFQIISQTFIREYFRLEDRIKH